MKSIEEAKYLIETGTAIYRRARRQSEVGRKAWNEYTESTRRKKTQRLRDALDSATTGNTYHGIRDIEEINRIQADINAAIKKYLFSGDAEGEALAKQYKEDFEAFLASLYLPSPLPHDRSARTKLWNEVKARILRDDAEKERLSLINEFKLDEGTTLRRAQNAAQKIRAEREQQAKREQEQTERRRLGLDEKADVGLASELTRAAAKALQRIPPQGHLYLRCWVMPDETRWYKIGITNNPRRREAEQNVLPVSMETLALASFQSIEQARAVELALHAVLDGHRIRGAQNKELFHLAPSQVTAIITVMNNLGLDWSSHSNTKPSLP